MTDLALPSGAMSEDFFHRARTRLTLEVPTALNDPSAQAKRGDLDLDPVAFEQRPRGPKEADAVVDDEAAQRHTPQRPAHRALAQ
jgi:hypothetical protein